MYFSDEEDPPSDVDSTVTPIETVPGGDRLYGYLLESDDLSSLDVLVDRQRERRARRTGLGKEGKEGGPARLVTYGPSCDQSDAQVVGRKRHPGKLVTYGSSSDQSDGPADPPLAPADLQDIYKELQEINKKLREENRILQEREQAVRERERMVAISEDSINTVNDYQARQAWRDREQQHVEEVSRLEQQLREKGKETKRLKENFETLKLANDTLRKELEMLQGQHEKLEKQSVSLQARLTNLQRKQEYSQRQLAAPVTQASAVQGYTEDKQGRQAKQKEVPRMVKVKVGSGVYEMVGVLLGWVSDLHLRQTITEQPTRPLEAALSPELLQEKCLKVLPNLAEVIRDFPAGQCSIYLPCLQFIYWSLLNLGQSQQLQKSSLSSTLRRLGEELYKPRMVRFQDEDRTDRPVSPPRGDRGDKSCEAMFFRSSDLHTRFLSSLIILKTLTQADVLAHVFDCLRTDLKTNTGKDLFLYYQATPVILPFLRPVHKTFLSSAVDIFLQMSMESSFLQQFLESCSNEQWFRTVAMALRSPSLDTQALEKISIILQKLSKIRSNKKFFEVYTIVSVVQELVRGAANDSAFLSMNLKSILFNLGVQNKLVAPSR